MCGSMLVLDLPDMAAAEAWAAEDPYAKAGLFETVTLREWIQVLP
ncbi:YciL protein [Sulfitobacter noctilucae]|nr:YciL protein [Sulfitobacter noctilucae]